MRSCGHATDPVGEFELTMSGDFSPAGIICGQGSPSSCMCVMPVSSLVSPAADTASVSLLSVNPAYLHLSACLYTNRLNQDTSPMMVCIKILKPCT